MASTFSERLRPGGAAGAAPDKRPPLAARLADRIRHGDIGALPVILGLVAIAVVFRIANPFFLTPLNLTNLFLQIASIGAIATGVVLVLLLGEIDLSVGAVSGLCAAVMAVVVVNHGLPGWLGVVAGLLAGLLIGLFQGAWITKLRVPSFVVTLAGYLGWQGALLWILGNTGTVNLSDPFIVALVNSRLPVWLGWALAAATVLAMALGEWRARMRRAGAGLPAEGSGRVALVVLRSAVLLAAVLLMSLNRNPRGNPPIAGVPTGVFIVLVLIALLDFVTTRTRFGRYVFAVGGSAEAARRAGIPVDRVRIAVFALASGLAAAGGLLAASRLYAVNQSSGGGDVLLNAIAAAVIGGTSLFGGRGSTWSALLGALVIGAIANGMDLLAFASSVRFMITGAVLLAAVTLDSYARSRREQFGR
ncbi:MAG TPA: sugar ABC transporter permease [Anaeromyxobacter sp.]|nr:sugar ABC transporter permease [Anaeromyxobacter sp.]